MNKYPYLILALLTCFISRSFAQPVCGFDDLHKNLMKNDPQYRQQVIEKEVQIQKAIKEQETRRSNARAESTMGTLYYIPVVVHVVHTGEPVGSSNNPSDAISVAPDTRKLLAGIYLVQVTINGKTTTRKIIKQ